MLVVVSGAITGTTAKNHSLIGWSSWIGKVDILPTDRSDPFVGEQTCDICDNRACTFRRNSLPEEKRFGQDTVWDYEFCRRLS